jgi:uncharacterized membrane protein YdjX (TVP38/TMEM64 family)
MQIAPTVKKILLAIAVLVATYAVMVLLLRAIGMENVHQMIHQTGIWAPIIFVILCAFSLVIAPLSGSSLYIVGGALFGKEVGFLLGLLATILGCSINFWISRKLGRKVASRFIGESHLDELDKFIQEIKSHHSIFYIALVMPLAQDMVSYAIGLTKVKYSHFLIALVISGMGIVAAYIYLGTSLLESLVGQ